MKRGRTWIGAFAPLLLIVPMATPLAIAAPPAAVERTLASGLEVVVLPMRGSGLVHVELRAPAGLLSQPPGQEGVAHVTAEMLRHGTTTRDAASFAAEIDRTGGELVASVGRDYATLGGTFFARDLAGVIELMSDAVRFPRFDEERMRGAVRFALRLLAAQEQTSAAADAQVLRTVFGDHPYALPTAGSLESLMRLSRDQVAAFHASRWPVSGCVLVVSGDVTAEQVMAAAETWFGSSQAAADPLLSTRPVGPPPHTRVVLIDRAIERAEIRIAWVAPARGSADEVALLAANALYGTPPAKRPGGERLRFGRELRTGYLNLRDAGVFTVAASAPFASASEAVNILLRDASALHRIVPGPDFEQVRRMLRQSLPLQHETLAQVASSWLAADFYGQPHDLRAHYDAEFSRLTAEAAGSAAHRWLDPARAVIVVVGPAVDLEKPLGHFGPVEVVRSGAGEAASAVLEPSTADQARGRELIAKAVRAHGGATRLSRIRDSRIDADITLNVGTQRLEGKLTQLRREPLQMVLVTEVGGVASRQTLSGRKGWRIAGDDSVAVDLDSLAVAGLRAGFSADLPHLLLAGQDSRARVYARGREPWGDVDALTVVVEAPGEPARTLFFHPESGGLLGFDQGEFSGAVVRRRYGDLRTVADILWPHREERQLEGETMMTVRVRSVQLNTGLADALFVKP